jgi:hypothetical protein
MQDTELFLSLAEIAGVFVGFGALIAVRSAGPTEAGDVTGIRWVMSTAIFVVIAALTPAWSAATSSAATSCGLRAASSR